MSLTTGNRSRYLTAGLAGAVATAVVVSIGLWTTSRKGPATVANMPVPSSVDWPGWAYQMRDQRLAAFPLSDRTTVRYVSTSGSDSNDGATTATAWKTLQKVSDYIQSIADDATARTVAIEFRKGDIWNYDTSSYMTTYTGTVSSGAGTTTLVLTAAPTTWVPRAGDHVQFYNGATRYGSGRVVSWTPGTKTLVLDTASNASTATVKVSCAVMLSKPVYLGCYDDPAQSAANRSLPVFSRFKTAVLGPATTNWANSAGRADSNDNVFSTAYTPGTSIARIKQFGTRDYVLRKVDSLANCNTYVGTWYWASNVVYVHPFSVVLDGGTPSVPMSNPKSQSTIKYEVCEKNYDTGIPVSDVDGAVVDSIWVDGYGASQTQDTSYEGVGLWAAVTGSNRVVVKNSWFTNDNRHALVVGGYNSSSGGDAVVDNCRGEWTNEGAVFVFYAPHGGMTGVLSNCRSKNQIVPTATQAFATNYMGPSSSCQLFYSHTGSTSYTHAMMLSINCEDEPSQWPGAFPGVFDYLPTWSDPKDCRGFVFGYKNKYRNATALDALGLSGGTNYTRNGGTLLGPTSGVGRCVYINSEFDSKVVKQDSGTNGEAVDLVWNHPASGYTEVYLNCLFNVDFGPSYSRDNTRKRAWFDYSGNKLVNCLVRFMNMPTGSVGLSQRVMGASDPGEDFTASNTVFWWDTDQNDSSNGLYIGNGHNKAGATVTQLVNNAYINVGVKTGTNGYDSDAWPVVDSHAPSDRPGKTSKLHVTASRSAGAFFGYDVGYDFYGRARGLDGKKTIGPFEAWGAE